MHPATSHQSHQFAAAVEMDRFVQMSGAATQAAQDAMQREKDRERALRRGVPKLHDQFLSETELQDQLKIT